MNINQKQHIFTSACPLCDEPTFTDLLVTLIQAKKIDITLPSVIHCGNCGDVEFTPELNS